MTATDGTVVGGLWSLGRFSGYTKAWPCFKGEEADAKAKKPRQGKIIDRQVEAGNFCLTPRAICLNPPSNLSTPMNGTYDDLAPP